MRIGLPRRIPETKISPLELALRARRCEWEVKAGTLKQVSQCFDAPSVAYAQRSAI
jgi:hypothetical protein